MYGDIPIPGSTKAKLIAVGIQQFSHYTYAEVEVDKLAAEAGVTVGALYHHFRSKPGLYGVLRDDMTRRVLDRMEAVAESVPPERAVKAALLAAFDGVLRIQAGKLLTEPDPRGRENAIALYLAALAEHAEMSSAHVLGEVLAAALRAALTQALLGRDGARAALEMLLM